MQTFLPFKSFYRSAEVLDRQRLGKQRLEAKHILKILSGEDANSGWRHHPAVKMWKGFEGALASYGLAICNEWCLRGYRDQQWDYFNEYIMARSEKGKIWVMWPRIIVPWWLGNEEFHSSHRAALLAKNPEHYSQFGWSEKPEIKYVWPTKDEKWLRTATTRRSALLSKESN